MSAGVESPKNTASRVLFGLHVSTLGWNAALARAEALALSQREPATIAFFGEKRLVRSLFRLDRRFIPERHLLLPAGGALLHRVLKLVWRTQPVEAAFSPLGFVSALLTYFAQPRRIGLIGDDKGRLETLCMHFTRHTPWHEFVAIAPGANPSGRLDLVIVDADAGDQIEKRLEGADIGLVILAGRGLRWLARPLPVTGRPQSSISKPSLA